MWKEETKVGGLRTAAAPALLLVSLAKNVFPLQLTGPLRFYQTACGREERRRTPTVLASSSRPGRNLSSRPALKTSRLCVTYPSPTALLPPPCSELIPALEPHCEERPCQLINSIRNLGKFDVLHPLRWKHFGFPLNFLFCLEKDSTRCGLRLGGREETGLALHLTWDAKAMQCHHQTFLM